MRGFSIITNFGCDTNCPYCVWKGHPLENCHDETDFDKLGYMLSFFPQEKVSVSGGGDPLYNMRDHMRWWLELAMLCHRYNKLLDVHTSQLLDENQFCCYPKRSIFNKYVLHLTSDRFHQLFEQGTFANFPTKLRLVFVVNNQLSLFDAKRIVTKVQEIGCELSFREHYPNSPSLELKNVAIENYVQELKNDKVKFVWQGDYNLYYMPDNKVYTDFFCKQGEIL